MSPESSDGGVDRTCSGGSGGDSNDEDRTWTGDGADSGRGRGSDDQSTEREGPSTAEKAVMVASIAFTVLLFSYAGWQMATNHSSVPPQPTVADTETLENGSVAVTVRLRNAQDVGLISATVSSNCTSPPIQYQFRYVPAASERIATLVCPPGTSDPSVSIATWESQ